MCYAISWTHYSWWREWIFTPNGVTHFDEHCVTFLRCEQDGQPICRLHFHVRSPGRFCFILITISFSIVDMGTIDDKIVIGLGDGNESDNTCASPSAQKYEGCMQLPVSTVMNGKCGCTAPTPVVPFYLHGFNFNPNMDKWLHPL